MSISYDVTSCAKLKCIVSCFNFGFEDNFIDRECLTIDMEQAKYNLIRHVFFCLFVCFFLHKSSFTAPYGLLSRV